MAGALLEFAHKMTCYKSLETIYLSLCLLHLMYRKVLIVLEVSVIKPASEVMSRIGDPKPLVTESKMDQQQQQPQHNGTGPTQHNMAGMAGL